MLGIVSFIIAAQSTLQVLPSRVEEWPQVPAGKVIATPDWSDYRIYPAAARAKNEEGRVVPQVLVGADGRPQACRVVQSSNFPALDFGSCELMMQMRFEPARDSAGRPIPSQYGRAMVWLLTDRRLFASSSLKAHVSISNGKQRSCDVMRAQGPYIAPWSALACTILSDTSYFFGIEANKKLDAIVEVRLDAGDHAALLAEPWPSGEALAAEKLNFVVNSKGDASDCAANSHGFGPRGLNNLSPCGRLLSILWFDTAKLVDKPAKGTFETRVYILPDQPK